MALCELCPSSPEALDHLFALVNGQRFDPDQGQLDEALLTLCAIHGLKPAEAPAWQAEVDARRELLEVESEEYEVEAAAAVAAVARADEREGMI